MRVYDRESNQCCLRAIAAAARSPKKAMPTSNISAGSLCGWPGPLPLPVFGNACSATGVFVALAEPVFVVVAVRAPASTVGVKVPV